MPNNPLMQSLLELHRVDREIEKLRSQKELLPVSLQRIGTRLERQQQTLAEKKERTKSLRAESRSQEVLLKSAEADAEKLRQQINKVSTNKEYAALQHEIATKQADASHIEDDILASMANIEAVETEVRQLGQSIAQVQREHDKETQAIDQEIEQLDERVRKLEAQRQKAAAAIEPELLDEYERIAAKKGASALAAVVGNTCQGCFMQLPPQLGHLLRAGTQVVRCSSCSRLLYLP